METGQILLEVARQFGVPVTLLAVVLWRYDRVVREKDTEIARINDARVKEKDEYAQRMLAQNKELYELFGEIAQMLKPIETALGRLLDRTDRTSQKN